MDKISVIMNDEGNSNSFESNAIVAIFEKRVALWSIIKRIPVCIDFSQELPSLRKDVQKFILQLDDCKIIVGKNITGIPYHLLNKMGFDIFEVELFTPAILDQILSDVKSASNTNTDNIGPVETNVPGVYLLDLIALQNKNPEISSKMVLQPFLTNTTFLQLDIICSHLPPWLKDFADKKGLTLTSNEKMNGTIKVSITKSCC